MTPLLTRASIIVVNYNGRQHLERCLRSVLPTISSRDEILVVDNGSTDGSADWVQQEFPSIRVVRSPINGGFGYGCNLGVRHAQGGYLVFLNPDTAVEKGWLEPLLAVLDDGPVALATALILLMDDPERVNTAGNNVHFTGLAFCRKAGAPRWALAEPTDVAAISGAAFAIRRSIWEMLGGLDESFFLYVEDTDLSWRARLAGYVCRWVPGSVVYHRYALHFREGKIFYQERNRYQMLLKTLRWPTLLLLLPALLLAEGVTWGYVLIYQPRRWAEKLQAYLWTICHWREVMARRRAVQAIRRIRDRNLLAGCTHWLEYEQTGAGFVARWAHRLLDPMFWVLYRLVLLVVWW